MHRPRSPCVAVPQWKEIRATAAKNRRERPDCARRRHTSHRGGGAVQPLFPLRGAPAWRHPCATASHGAPCATASHGAPALRGGSVRGGSVRGGSSYSARAAAPPHHRNSKRGGPSGRPSSQASIAPGALPHRPPPRRRDKGAFLAAASAFAPSLARQAETDSPPRCASTAAASRCSAFRAPDRNAACASRRLSSSEQFASSTGKPAKLPSDGNGDAR